MSDDVVLVPLLALVARVRQLVGLRAVVEPREQPAQVAEQRWLPELLLERRSVVEHHPLRALERGDHEAVVGIAVRDLLHELTRLRQDRLRDRIRTAPR